MVTIEQQTIFRSDLLFLFNNLNIVLINSNSFVQVQKKYFFEFKFVFDKMIEFKFEFAALVKSPITCNRRGLNSFFRGGAENLMCKRLFTELKEKVYD